MHLLSRRALRNLTLLGALLGAVAPACSSGEDQSPSGSGGEGGEPGGPTGGTSSSTGGQNGGSDDDLSLAGNSNGASSSAGGSGSACFAIGQECESGRDCCSAQCDVARGVCAANFAACGSEGATCESGIECCSVSCLDGRCSGDQCLGDGESCEVGEECCSGQCTDGVCADLNGSAGCETAGNTCANDADCCSRLCSSNGVCLLGSSFCVQLNDLCTDDEQCCHGTCEIQDGEKTGFCAVQESSGSGCDNKLMAGEVCEGDCSSCCSRSCAPHPTSGKTVCQPPGGCRPSGELCRSDLDCCGGDPDADLPGAGNGHCEDINEEGVGRCKTLSCTPQGGICKYDDPNYVEFCGGNSTSPNNCCSFLGSKSNCALDLLRIPRCDAIDECREEGESCATSGDCCGGVPCVQNESGAFVCYGPPDGECVAVAGPCTIDADCCPGSLCLRLPGNATGSCGDGTVDPPGGGDGSGGSSTGNGSGGGGGLGCSAYGQSCEESADCCEGVPCEDGRCLFGFK